MFNSGSMSKQELSEKYEYEFKDWINNFKSYPIEEIELCDRSEDYSIDKIHVFKLEDNNYAVVVESGCSCYSNSDAQIEIFSSKKDAIAKYEKWEHDQNLLEPYGKPCSCGKHVK